jgi:hypothetical protein
MEQYLPYESEKYRVGVITDRATQHNSKCFHGKKKKT